MSDKNKMGFNSKAVHAGYHVKAGPVNPPVERSSTCVFDNCEDGAARFASADKKGIYSRLNNPNCDALEKKIAALEGGYGGIATASGMAAVEAVYYTFLNSTSHVVATSSVYGPSRSILEKDAFYKKWGVRSTFLDTSDIDAVRRAAQIPNTDLIFLESPANPTLAITDIARVAEIAREVNVTLVIDNTFCSPYLQNPLSLGVDIVLHSMTKSIGGHANAVGGMLITKTEENYWQLRDGVVNRGAILSPDNADLFITGVKTLGLRMERMQDNARVLADFLRSHEKIAWIKYPGFDDHPGRNLIGPGRQMRGPGCMLTFGVDGGYEGAKALLNNLKLAILAVSLGGVESLIQHPASMTHAGVPEDERVKAGITADLIRLSVGIEDIDDLKADFRQALENV